MARRYDFTELKKRFDGKRSYKTILYPKIPLRSDDIYVYAKEGDRLDLLADRYYGDTSAWWVIARANNIGKGSMYVEGGTQLRIPRNIESIYRQLENFNKSK